MKKSDAAKFLDISEKTLERLVKNGEISSKLEKGKTRDVVVFDDTELKNYKEKRESAKHRPAFAASDDALSLIPTKADNLDRQNQTLEFFDVFRSALTSQNSSVPIADKILLTVNDCRLLTGLSEQNLRDAIHDGKLSARIIGRGYKVKRKDLDAFIESL